MEASDWALHNQGLSLLIFLGHSKGRAAIQSMCSVGAMGFDDIIPQTTVAYHQANCDNDIQAEEQK